MQHGIRLTVDIGEVLLWTNWIDCASRRLSFDLPPKELLVLFVVRSLERAHSLNLILDKRLPKEIVDEHIQGYLLGRVWAYRLLTELVREDVRACGSKGAHIDSEQLLRTSRRMVGRVMLQQGLPAESIAVRTMARRAVLRSLKLSCASVEHNWTRSANVVPFAQRQSSQKPATEASTQNNPASSH